MRMMTFQYCELKLQYLFIELHSKLKCINFNIPLTPTSAAIFSLYLFISLLNVFRLNTWLKHYIGKVKHSPIKSYVATTFDLNHVT